MAVSVAKDFESATWGGLVVAGRGGGWRKTGTKCIRPTSRGCSRGLNTVAREDVAALRSEAMSARKGGLYSTVLWMRPARFKC